MQNRKKLFWLIPVLHILLSLICEFAVSGFSLSSYEGMEMEPVRDGILSLEGERILFFIYSKAAGCILIFLLWRALFAIVGQKRKLLALLLPAAAAFAVLIYPFNYLMEEDNLILYAESVNYYPDYWQSYLTGVFYNACLMVCRHSAAIPVIQNCLFVGGIWFLGKQAGERWGRYAAIAPYLLLLFPESYEIGLNPYRNDLYAVVCLWFFTLLFFDWLSDKSPSGQKKLGILSLCALLAVWRGEGIVLCIAALCLCLFVWRLAVPRRLLWLGAFAAVCVLLAFPQKEGEYRYYGKDYQIINYMDVLQDILQDSESNLTYEGADEDLAGIELAVPLQTLREAGMLGFRINNLQTKGTINQTFLSLEEQETFLASANGILAHNLGIYLQNRVRCFAEAAGILERTGSYAEENFTDTQRLETFQQGILDSQKMSMGLTLIMSSGRAAVWYQNQTHLILYQIVNAVVAKVLAFYEDINLCFLLRCLSVVLLIAMEGCAIRKKGLQNRLPHALIVCAILGLWLAVFLFVPEGRKVYYYPVYYVTLLWGGCTLADNIKIDADRSLPEEQMQKS